MFQTTLEGLAVYRQALIILRMRAGEMDLVGEPDGEAWSQEEWLPWVPSKDPKGLPPIDFMEVAGRSMRLRGMEVVLGLTRKEAWDAHVWAGLKVGEAPPP